MAYSEVCIDDVVCMSLSDEELVDLVSDNFQITAGVNDTATNGKTITCL